MSSLVKITHGDIFISSMEVITVPVNTVGVMGKGLALAFAKKFPRLELDYRDKCMTNQLKVGCPYLWKDPVMPRAPIRRRNVLVFPTKTDWRKSSNLRWIEMGIEHVYNNLKLWEIKSLAVPALGCGLGELPWSEVRWVLEEALGRFNIPVELYEPI